MFVEQRVLLGPPLQCRIGAVVSSDFYVHTFVQREFASGPSRGSGFSAIGNASCLRKVISCRFTPVRDLIVKVLMIKTSLSP